ncbi:Galactosyltransferase [Handroanthus impetiginosus]|uniref:Galactosyltransferase n=1 Tax=Handroanthus impetiginosus TaxID=429701 RepID=A0A2G9GH37_9LAMI|nr:Galactosyltransferase [Handroanthus impetiginosus]
MGSSFPKDFFTGLSFGKTLLVSGLVLYLILVPFFTTQVSQIFLIKWASSSQPVIPKDPSRTNLSHIAFGLLGSVKTWPHRRGYLEAWWRPNQTRGYVYLDKPPTPDLLPWPQTAPPYRVVDNISYLLQHIKPRFELMPRMVHGILELFKEEHDNMRWIVMGDDDSIFFVDNIVDVLAEYDHTKYYYLGWHSESVISNYWFSFDQAFGGGGIVLSYPLAKALVKDMDGCLIRYAQSTSADLITMTCIADIGVNLTPHKGIHQVDLHGDFSGYLSAHPKVPLMTFHHFDAMDPIFPSMDRMESTRHLMKAANADQSRLLQQTICYHRQTNWSFSISWGYSAQIYERIMPRSYLQMPIETFRPWARGPKPPFYMFNTRPLSEDPCEAPHFFFFESVYKSISGAELITSYVRARPRGLPACSSSGNHSSADSISRIQVFSPAKKRIQIDRCECCDIIRVDNAKAKVKFRECKIDEIIA